MNRLKKLNLTLEDIELFNYLFKYRLSTGKRIYKDIYYKYKNFNVSRQRLIALRKTGYLRGKYYSLDNREMCYFLTSEAVKEYIDYSHKTYIWKGTNSPSHDIDLIDIWKVFQNVKKFESSYTENEINNRDGQEFDMIRECLGRLKPDGFFTIRAGDRTLNGTIEYERSIKTEKRYRELIDRYYRHNSVDIVLFISKTGRIQNLVMETDREYRTANQAPKIFYTLSQNLFDKRKLEFKSSEYNSKPLVFNVVQYTTKDTTAKVVTPVVSNPLQGMNNIRKSIIEGLNLQKASYPHAGPFHGLKS